MILVWQHLNQNYVKNHNFKIRSTKTINLSEGHGTVQKGRTVVVENFRSSFIFVPFFPELTSCVMLADASCSSSIGNYQNFLFSCKEERERARERKSRGHTLMLSCGV